MRDRKVFMLKCGVGILALTFALSFAMLGSNSTHAAPMSVNCSSNHMIQVTHDMSNCGLQKAAQPNYYPNPQPWPYNWCSGLYYPGWWYSPSGWVWCDEYHIPGWWDWYHHHWLPPFYHYHSYPSEHNPPSGGPGGMGGPGEHNPPSGGPGGMGGPGEHNPPSGGPGGMGGPGGHNPPSGGPGGWHGDSDAR